MNRFKSFDSWLNNKTIIESEKTNEAEVQEPVSTQTATETETTKTPSIYDDVDNIMNSLEVLSSELTEQFDVQIDSILNEEIELINENFLENLKKQIMSMKAYATLSSAYPKFKKDESKQKIKKIEALGQYDLSSEEKISALKDKTKEKFQKAIDDAKGIENKAKKQLTVQKLRDARDEALKVGKDSSIQKKIDAGKAKLTLKLDNIIRNSTKDITDLLAAQKIESELMKKQWDKEKLEIDDKAAMDLLDQELDAKLEFAEDSPEAQKRMQASTAKAKKELAKEKAQKMKEAEADIKELSDEYQRLSDSGDEKQKEANLKIKQFFDNGQKYSQALSATLSAGGEPTPEQKKALIEARKAYNAAKNSITAGTFTVADSKLSKEDAEEQFVSFKSMMDSAVEEYDAKVQGFEKEDEDDDTETLTDDQTAKIEAEETQMAERQEKLEAELAKPEEERNQGMIDGLKAGIAKNKQDIADIKAASNDSVQNIETIEEDRSEEIEDDAKKLAEPKDLDESEETEEEVEETEEVVESCESCDCNPCECDVKESVEETEEEVEANEASVVVDATDPKSKILKKLLKKHNVKLEVLREVGDGGGWPEVELTGDKKDLQAVLQSRDGWDTDDLDEYIEESNGTFTVKVKALYEEEVEEVEEGRKIIDPSTFKDDKLNYNDQFRGNTSLSKSLSSDLGLDPKKPWTEGIGFDDQAMYSVGNPSGTIANDALSGKYTYADLLAMAKKHYGIEESSEEVEDNTTSELSEEATKAGLTELAAEISTKENWQVAEGTKLRSMYESKIKKSNADTLLNEQRHSIDSVKDAFSKLI